MNGMSINLTWTRTIRLGCTEDHDPQREPGPGRDPDGRGLDDHGPDRPGAVGAAVRPDRPAGGGLAAAGLGGGDPGGRGAAPAVAVQAADPAGYDRPRHGDRRGDDAA